MLEIQKKFEDEKKMLEVQYSKQFQIMKESEERKIEQLKHQQKSLSENLVKKEQEMR